MRILIADPDPSLLALVRRTLEAEGHQVRVASAPEALDVASADGRIDAVLLDAQIAFRAKESCKRLRDSDAFVFVTTSLSDGNDNIRKLRDWFQGAGYLRKPFSVLDLPYELSKVARRSGGRSRAPLGGADLLGRMAARGAAGPRRSWRPPVERANRSLMPRMGGPVAYPVAERLAGAWMERFSGQVRIRAHAATLGRPLTLRNGGLVDVRDHSLVDIAIRGAELQFMADPLANGVDGDRAALIQILWTAVHSPAEIRFAEKHAFEAVECTRKGILDELRFLLGPDTVRVLDAADGARALGEVVVQAMTTPTAIAADLQALLRLGLIRFSPPVTRHVDRRRRTDAPPDETPVRVSSGSRKRSSAKRASRSRRASSSKRTRQSSASTARRSGRATVAERMRRAGRSDAVHKRLELEVSRLADAAPAEVLGIPHDATNKLVREVGGRMRERYAAIAEDDGYPDETRALAATLVERVQHALNRWGHSQERAAADPTTQRETIMYEQAMVMVGAGDFPKADRMLVMARELAMANPKILAALGWARFNNPDRPEEERREEGRDYLLLAEQFDNSDIDTEWALVKVYKVLGDHPAALRRARRVLQLDPEHADAKLAVKELGDSEAAEG